MFLFQFDYVSSSGGGEEISSTYPENTYRWGKDHCTAGLQFNMTGTDQLRKYYFICIKLSSLMQPF